MKLAFAVQTKIQKPVMEVFEAVQNPDKLSAYFTNGGASAPLIEGTTVEWSFADISQEKIMSFPVTVEKVIPNKQIVFNWEGAEGLETRVEMNFYETGFEEASVKIEETGWRENQTDLESSYLNCQGWTQMLCCLKAYVEYGINLRKGAF